MAVNAARQQRYVPVRLTASVSSQISGVKSAKGAGVSTPAAQTRAATGPACPAAVMRRSTCAALLTSAGTGIASPPACRMRLATSSRASWSRAARTTRAPAAARASAAAAPIPRLAPVTTATRPASQWALSPIVCPAGTRSDSPVEALVRVQAQLEVEMASSVAAACSPRYVGRLPDCAGESDEVTGRHQEAGDAVRDHFAEPAAAERNDRSAARLRLGGSHPEGLVPLGRVQDQCGARHCLP